MTMNIPPVLQAGVQEASRGAERGARGGQGLGAGSVGTEQRAGTEQRPGELAEEGGGPAGTGTVLEPATGRCQGNGSWSFT